MVIEKEELSVTEVDWCILDTFEIEGEFTHGLAELKSHLDATNIIITLKNGDIESRQVINLKMNREEFINKLKGMEYVLSSV